MTTLGFILALCASILWGMVYIASQKALEVASPFLLLAIGAIITLLVVGPILYFDPRSVKLLLGAEKSVWTLILLTEVLVVLANIFILTSIKYLGATTASILEITYPFFVIVFSMIVFRTVPNLYFVIGSVLIFAGSAVLIRAT